MTVTMFRYLILIGIDFYDSISLVLVLIEKIYQTLKTVFDHISKSVGFCRGSRVKVSVTTIKLSLSFDSKL